MTAMEPTNNDKRNGRPIGCPSDLEAKAQAAAGAILAIAEYIRDIGTIPSGHLYARLVELMSLETYETIIGILVESGKVKSHPNHLLEWVGPQRAALRSQESNNRKENQAMNTVSIPANATAKTILATHKPPREATHFRYTEGRRKPVVDTLKNIDCLAGCTGKLEFGKVSFEGRGRHAKIKEFIPLVATPEATTNRVTILEANRPPEMIEPETEDAPKIATGRKNKIHGFSACAVAKALGKAGIKWEEADRIMRAHGIEMSKASLSVQLGFGRNEATWEKRGEPAPLTDDQIAGLRKEVEA